MLKLPTDLDGGFILVDAKRIYALQADAGSVHYIANVEKAVEGTNVYIGRDTFFSTSTPEEIELLIEADGEPSDIGKARLYESAAPNVGHHTSTSPDAIYTEGSHAEDAEGDCL